MKIYGMQLVETVTDRICDVCGDSVIKDVNGHKYSESGELKAQWGYGSKEDGVCYQLDLCEDCFKVALLALKDHRRTLTGRSGCGICGTEQISQVYKKLPKLDRTFQFNLNLLAIPFNHHFLIPGKRDKLIDAL